MSFATTRVEVSTRDRWLLLVWSIIMFFFSYGAANLYVDLQHKWHLHKTVPGCAHLRYCPTATPIALCGESLIQETGT